MFGDVEGEGDIVSVVSGEEPVNCFCRVRVNVCARCWGVGVGGVSVVVGDDVFR